MRTRKAVIYSMPPLIFMLFAASSITVSADWEIQPIVETRIGYSDNIEFNDDDEEKGFIAQVNPGISVDKLNGPLQIQLDYLMHNFYYLNGGQLDTDHDLDAIARYSLIPRKLFINSFARVSQVLIDNDRQISVDNLNDTDNTTDEYFYGIGPQLIQNIGGYAQANISYLYSIQEFDDKTAGEDGGRGDIDDNDSQLFNASLANLHQQSDRLDWTASYEKEIIDFDESDKFKFTTRQIEAGYRLLPNLEVVGSYGYEKNDLGDIVLFDDDDGSIWSAGVLAGLGEFTVLEVRRAERFFGDFWLGSLEIAGPKLAFRGEYEEIAEFSGIDDTDFEALDRTNALNQLDTLENDVDISPDDRNSASVIKRWEFGLAYNRGKSTYLAEFENEDEDFLDTGNTEKSEQYTLGWIWQLTGISSLSLISEYTQDKSFNVGDGENKSDLIDIEVIYRKQLSAKADADVTYTYTEGDSDAFDDDFTSNTISAGLIYRF